MRIAVRLMGFLRKYWKQVTFAYICLLISTGFSLLIPEMLKRAIDQIHVGSSNVAVGDPRQLMYFGLVIVVASLARGIFAFGQSFTSEWVGQRVAYNVRNMFYDRIQRLSFNFHDTAQTGQLMSRATQDVESINMFVSQAVISIIYTIMFFIGIAIVLFVMNWKLALLSLALMPIVAYRAISMNLRLRPLWVSIQEGLARTGTILQENFSGVRVVKAFAQEDYELKKYSTEAKDFYEKTLLSGKIQAFNGPLMGFIFSCSTTIILLYGGREVMLNHLTIGQLLQFYSYLGMVVWPVRQLGWLITLYTRGIASGERIYEILDAESAVKEKPNAVKLKDVKGVVRFEDVSFKYNALKSFGPTGNILDHVSIEARPGEMIALIGATGSGKTTVVNLIPRFYDATSGQVLIDGIDVRDVTLTSLRRYVGIVQQDVFLFTGTVRDNISYGAINATPEDVFRAAKAAYLHDFIESLPEGYDTWVGERGITLSGGQRQRLSIARTILLDPRILIFDDSTSSVDTETEYLIQRALRHLMVGRTSFVIAQRLQTVKDADRIYVLELGKVVEHGTHDQLLREGRVYPSIYELQLKDQEEALSREGAQ